VRQQGRVGRVHQVSGVERMRSKHCRPVHRTTHTPSSRRASRQRRLEHSKALGCSWVFVAQQLPPPRLLRSHPSSGRRGGITSLPSFSRRGGAKRRGGYTFNPSPGTAESTYEAQQQPFAPAAAAPVAYDTDPRRSASMEATSESTTGGPQVQAPTQRRTLRLGLLLPARAPRGGTRRRGT
jgi:hypothetical protein